jgi:hypothetical protein
MAHSNGIAMSQSSYLLQRWAGRLSIINVDYQGENPGTALAGSRVMVPVDAVTGASRPDYLKITVVKGPTDIGFLPIYPQGYGFLYLFFETGVLPGDRLLTTGTI